MGTSSWGAKFTNLWATTQLKNVNRKKRKENLLRCIYAVKNREQREQVKKIFLLLLLLPIWGLMVRSGALVTDDSVSTHFCCLETLLHAQTLRMCHITGFCHTHTHVTTDDCIHFIHIYKCIYTWRRERERRIAWLAGSCRRQRE